MKQLKLFVNLTRLNRPIGYMLLFWPCSWGLAYAYSYNREVEKFLLHMVLFFLGAVLMRSAGCIVNDIVDRKIDKKVSRTKFRPLASNQVTVIQAFFYALILCMLAFLILIQFNFLTIFLGMSSMILAFSYPFMKRITYWPQLFLGLTFNWGIIMAWTSINNSIPIEILIIYIAAIFWTLGYDTIYGAQDIIDDEVIGLKSTSIKFKSTLKRFVLTCYLISFLILLFFFYKNMQNLILIIPFLAFSTSLIFQVIHFNRKKPITCLNAFKINNFSGLFLFLAMMGLSL